MPATIPDFQIAGRPIGVQHAPYVIAEVSANHCQDIEIARSIVRNCAAAGVDAVKLQTYRADTVTLDVDSPNYRIDQGTWSGQRLFDLYESAMTPWDWTQELADLAKDLGVALFSTPFDPSAVEFLETLDVPAYKIASFELTYHQLLATVAGTGKPIILSTGLATHAEISEALAVLQSNGAESIALLKCTSSYPASMASLNLRLIPAMAADFSVPIGYSDHTVGNVAATAAVALGACIVEKHVKDASSAGSADESFSSLATDMKLLVEHCNQAFAARGSATYGPTEEEVPSLRFRRSLIANRDIAKGEMLDEGSIAIRRPMIGAQPKDLNLLAGRRAIRDITRGEGMTPDDVD